MKQSMIVAAMLALAVPAHAQFGIDQALKKAQQVKDAKDKFDDLNVTEEEERKIGEDVSAKIRQRFGVVQERGRFTSTSRWSARCSRSSPSGRICAWTFIVLDTDGVNAFASPGGIVHITRGALGLITSEAELAGVLAHEIGHVAHKHTVNAIKKNKAVQLGTNETLSSRGPFLDKLANKAYEMVLENKFDRGDEMDADKVSVTLTEKAGYAPGTLADVPDAPRRAQQGSAGAERPVRVAPRHQGAHRRDQEARGRQDRAPPSRRATRRTSSTSRRRSRRSPRSRTAPPGSRDRPRPRTRKKSRRKKRPRRRSPKKGFGLGSLKPASSSERQTAQVSASGGSRGLGPDRTAKGGGNPAIVKASVSDAEVAAFKKGIA